MLGERWLQGGGRRGHVGACRAGAEATGHAPAARRTRVPGVSLLLRAGRPVAFAVFLRSIVLMRAGRPRGPGLAGKSESWVRMCLTGP